MHPPKQMMCAAAERMTNVVTKRVTNLQVFAVLHTPCIPYQSQQTLPGGGPLLRRGSGGTHRADCNTNQSAGTCRHHAAVMHRKEEDKSVALAHKKAKVSLVIIAKVGVKLFCLM